MMKRLGEIEETHESSRAASLPLSPMQEGLIEAIKHHKGAVRHSALNAVRGLRRAWLIAEIDPEMAYFRAITAEEEAATALIKALVIRKYPGARSLNPRRHADKIGWIALIETLGRMFSESGLPQPMVHLQKDVRPPRIDVHLPSEGMGLPEGYHATPDEPLNMLISEGSPGTASIESSFTSQLQAFAEGKGAGSIRADIDNEANLRNRLLYASDGGWPEVNNPDAVILERRSRVFLLLGLVIVILQTRSHQLLAKHALKAYLAALGIAAHEPIDLTAPDHGLDYLIEVRKNEGAELTARVRRKARVLYVPMDLNFTTACDLGAEVFVGDVDGDDLDLNVFGSITLDFD